MKIKELYETVFGITNDEKYVLIELFKYYIPRNIYYFTEENKYFKHLKSLKKKKYIKQSRGFTYWIITHKGYWFLFKYGVKLKLKKVKLWISGISLTDFLTRIKTTFGIFK